MKKSSLRPIALLFTFLFALTASAQLKTDEFTTKSGKKITITCIKHASMEINYNGVEIEVDPVGMWLKPETDYATFPKANIILVTHEHKDHFDRAAIHEIRTPATSIYVNQAVFGHFRNGLVMQNGDVRKYASDITIEAVPAYNTTPEHKEFHPKGRDNGYILTLDGFRIYIAGDTEDIPEMADIKDIDVAFHAFLRPEAKFDDLDALMAQMQWPEARDFWLKLLKLSQDAEQQQYVQSRLAATLVYSGNPEAIFAADSAITSLRYRSRVLKAVASPERLRQQASQGPNNEERTIALHTLLVRDLTENRFSDWLNDRKLASAITSPVIGKAFDDVNLSVFDWNGDAAEAGYVCRSLDQTVQVLSQNAADAHALNCLGEFFRTTNTHVDLWKESAGNGLLEAAIHRKEPYGQFDRQAYYQQVITSPKAEHEDKSYALYRAIMCYAPSGYNECGGTDVDKAQRKGWFSQLKTQYPGSPWAQKLKYYW